MSTSRQEAVNVTEPLLELLRGIDFAFGQKSDESLSYRLERERCAAVIVAIGRFLMKIGSPHADRFFDLSDAFADLNLGARPPIFRVSKQRSAPNPTQIEAAKANVAFALDALIKLGKSQSDAAKTLLRKFPGIKNLAGPKSHRPDYSWEKTILEWRKGLAAPSRRKNKLAAEIFSVGRELIDFLIKENRRDELVERAIGRAKLASRIGVFVARSNTL
jgi:hypothetical protein